MNGEGWGAGVIMAGRKWLNHRIYTRDNYSCSDGKLTMLLFINVFVLALSAADVPGVFVSE